MDIALYLAGRSIGLLNIAELHLGEAISINNLLTRGNLCLN